MCGIAGVVSRGAARQFSGAVRRMIALQKHRGPDGEGFYESSHAALGHCRLAIFDPSAAGHQPMSDREGRYWLTFNGAIYNFLELLEDLQRAGYSFRGRGDTEVLLAAYCEWGPACVDRLRGMFAFAVWDNHEQRLFAARDRLGIKPFHYWAPANGTELAFASEPKALLEFLPDCAVNTRLASEFLAWSLLDHDPAETMLQGIARLPPGHWLTWDRQGGLRIQQVLEASGQRRAAQHASPAADAGRRVSRAVRREPRAAPAHGRAAGKLSQRRAGFVVDCVRGEQGPARPRKRGWAAADVQLMLRRPGAG